jgi:hypothetical protein
LIVPASATGAAPTGLVEGPRRAVSWDQLVGGVMLFSALLQTDMYRDFVEHGGLNDHR